MGWSKNHKPFVKYQQRKYQAREARGRRNGNKGQQGTKKTKPNDCRSTKKRLGAEWWKKGREKNNQRGKVTKILMATT